MTARLPLRAWLAAGLLLAACDRGGPSTPATEANVAVAVPQALAASQTTRGCGRHGAVVVETNSARPLPALTGRVVDNADLLPPPAERRIADDLAGLEAETTDQVVVVTVPSLEGERIESLGLRLGNGWRIGREDVDNGVLLIVAPNDRVVRIEVGCGLEGLLTDERAQQIIETALVPRFRDGQFGEGIEAGVAEVLSVLRSSARRPQPWRQSATS